MRGGRELALRAALIAASVALVFYAVEATLHLTARDPAAETCRWVESPQRCRAALEAGLSFDTRSIHQVIADFSERGVEAWPAIVPRQISAEDGDGAAHPARPIAGISDAVTVYCNRGEHVVYRSDEHGFRNPPGLHRPGLEVALVGDSFAQGYCVESGETIADGLRERFPHTLNLGVDDSGPLLELAALREYAEPLRPPVVLWLYFEGNDLADLERESRKEILKRYLRPGFTQELRARQPEIDSLLERFVSQRARAHERRREAEEARIARDREQRFRRVRDDLLRVAKLKQIRRRLEEAISSPSPRDASTLRPVLEAARDAVASWSGTLYFVYLPAWERFADRDAASTQRAEVLAIAGELGLPTVDATESFEAHDDPLSLFPLRRPGHYTAEGYAVVGRAIAEKLHEREAGARS